MRIIGGVNETQLLDVNVHVVRNSAPVSGTAGRAIFCDGKDDFLFNADFTWPVIEYSAGPSGETVAGGGPVTIEWWGLNDGSSKRDSALVSIGNKEQAAGWV